MSPCKNTESASSISKSPDTVISPDISIDELLTHCEPLYCNKSFVAVDVSVTSARASTELLSMDECCSNVNAVESIVITPSVVNFQRVSAYVEPSVTIQVIPATIVP